LTWDEVDRRANAVAEAIRNVAPPATRVLVLCPPGLSFIPAFFGALRAGAIAVPAYPPRLGRAGVDPNDRLLTRLRAIVADASPAIVLATTALVERAHALPLVVPGLRGATWSDVDRLHALDDRAA